MWWERKLPLVGQVLFRGEFPPRIDEFAFLETQGISMKTSVDNSPQAWAIDLSHPEWGKAQLVFREDLPLPPREEFEHVQLPQHDRDAAISCRSHVMLRFESSRGHILRDRKLMLRYLRAIMADDGVVAIDDTSQNVWTRESLDDELSHDADVDVEALYCVHLLSEGNDKSFWMHTHGLANVGFFDFDILQPSPDVVFGCGDLCRAMSFHILEGSLAASSARFPLVHPKGDIRMVEMERFLRNTDPALASEITASAPASHFRDRSVVCEPEPSAIARLFGRKKLAPSRMLSRDLPDNPMFGFSTPASDLMAERARGTYSVLRSLHQEFAEFEFPVVVKIGFRTDGGTENDKEHMWFEVHELRDDSIDCTCVNSPYHVSSLHEGDRGVHPVEMLSDWVIVTPAGHITPRSSNIARIIRSRADEMRQFLQENS